MARPAFRAGPAQVRVPATSANLGPGFDTLGLALALYDDAVARIGENGLVLDVAGEGANEVPHDESHLMVRAMRTVFERLGGQPRGIELVCANHIPHGRGLGSSAAAIVAGVLLACALVVGGDAALPDSDVLALAAELEGHPDNVAACLLGGLTIAWSEDARPDLDAGPASGATTGQGASAGQGANAREGSDAGSGAATGGVDAISLAPDPSISAVAFVAPDPAPTAPARALLPERVPHADAAFNVARAALLVTALTGRPEVLFAATEDRLHQPYRAAPIADSAALLRQLRTAGLPAVISGAGPTVLVLARTPGEVDAAIARAPQGWHAGHLALTRTGAHLVR